MDLVEDFWSDPIAGQHDKPKPGQNDDGGDNDPAGGVGGGSDCLLLQLKK